MANYTIWGEYLKKIVLFSLFSCILIILMPMVSSIETNLVIEDLKYRFRLTDKNLLLNNVEGGYTIYLPTEEKMSIYNAAMKYKENRIPLIVIAGREYGTGSSRDWAAKGTALLGVKAVLAESFERIHRSNLIGMGVLPLQFDSGENWKNLGLTGKEFYHLSGIASDLTPGKKLNVNAISNDGMEKSFQVLARLDTPIEVKYYENGGILQTVLRQMIKGS